MFRWARKTVLALVAISGWSATMGAGCGGGTPAGGPPVEQSTPELGVDVLVCGTQTVRDSDGTSRQRSEWYVPNAMNNKLRLYPDFAAAAGMSSVSDCEGARRLIDAYDAYVVTHPGFDVNQPIDIKGILAGPPPTHPPGSVAPPPPLILKQDRGTLQGNPPIVRALGFDSTTLPNGSVFAAGEECTATFIAKNWVTLAAHCFDFPAPIPPLNPKSPRWAQFIFVPALSNGTVDRNNTFVCSDVLMIPNTNYLGYPVANRPQAHYDPHDFALLYISPECDRQMPVQADGTPAFMALGGDISLIGSPGEQWWGYGPHLRNPPVSTNMPNPPPSMPYPNTDLKVYDTDTIAIDGGFDPNGTGFAVQFLSFGLTAEFANASGHVYPDFDFLRDVNKFVGWVPQNDLAGNPYSGPFLCRGDSGGPLVEEFDLTTTFDAPPTLTNTQIISGVASDFDGPDGVFTTFRGKPNVFPECLEAVGDWYAWQPTWTEIGGLSDFVNTTIGKWAGRISQAAPPPSPPDLPFSCYPYSTVTTGARAWVCQSDPCMADADCCTPSSAAGGTGLHDCSIQRFYCDHPGPSLPGPSNLPCMTNPPPIIQGGATTAAFVCPLTQDCSCIQGQCLPVTVN